MSDLAARVSSGKAPAALRLAAARGALPLPPAEVLWLQVQLRQDGEADVRAAAEESLSTVSAQSAATLADDPEAPAGLVAYLLLERTDLPAAQRADLVAHPAAETHTLADLARRENDPLVLDALLANQKKLMTAPALVEAIRENASLTHDQRRRLADMAEHLLREAPPPEAPLSSDEEDEDLSEQERETEDGIPLASDPRLAALGVDAEVEAMLPLLDIDVGDLLETSEILGGEEFEHDEEHATAYRRILHLTVGQKLRLAVFGTREERNILVRDTNKLIACSVVKNPRITETEIEQISNSRNVNEEVLRLVSRRKEAVRRYPVVHNLVKNPKTPLSVAMGLVSRLNDRDLKLLARDRNVSEAVRTNARKQVQVRAARQKTTTFRRH